jgi:hypothetical protein
MRANMTEVEKRDLNPETAAELEKMFKVAMDQWLASKENSVAEISPEEKGHADPPADTSDQKTRTQKPG